MTVWIKKLPDYARLFVSVFNKAPWHDAWTVETAARRIENAMSHRTFEGLALYDDSELKGFIYGAGEPFYDGMHFQILEFCVRDGEQHKGYGKRLLSEMLAQLKEAHVVKTYLLTLTGAATEGYYEHHGFK